MAIYKCAPHNVIGDGDTPAARYARQLEKDQTMANEAAGLMQAEIDCGRALARAVKRYLAKLRADPAPWDATAREEIGGAHREMLGALMDYDARFLAPLDKYKKEKEGGG